MTCLIVRMDGSNIVRMDGSNTLQRLWRQQDRDAAVAGRCRGRVHGLGLGGAPGEGCGMEVLGGSLDSTPPDGMLEGLGGSLRQAPTGPTIGLAIGLEGSLGELGSEQQEASVEASVASGEGAGM